MTDDSKQDVNQMSERLLERSTNNAIEKLKMMITIEAEAPSTQEMSIDIDVSHNGKKSRWREWLAQMWEVLTGIFVSTS